MTNTFEITVSCMCKTMDTWPMGFKERMWCWTKIIRKKNWKKMLFYMHRWPMSRKWQLSGRQTEKGVYDIDITVLILRVILIQVIGYKSNDFKPLLSFQLAFLQDEEGLCSHRPQTWHDLMISMNSPVLLGVPMSPWFYLEISLNIRGQCHFRHAVCDVTMEQQFDCFHLWKYLIDY